MVENQYRPCRWYDQYPQLVFALRLLYLAPEQTRRRVIAAWFDRMKSYWGLSSPEMLPTMDMAGGTVHRWYDGSDDIRAALECVKHCPEPVKTVSVHAILECLDEVNSAA